MNGPTATAPAGLSFRDLVPAAPVPDVPEEDEAADEVRDDELSEVVRLLRAEASLHMLCARPRHAECVEELIAKLERLEHRR